MHRHFDSASLPIRFRLDSKSAYSLPPIDFSRAGIIQPPRDHSAAQGSVVGRPEIVQLFKDAQWPTQLLRDIGEVLVRRC